MPPARVSRRHFVQVASASVLVAACSDDKKKASDTALDAADTALDTTPETTAPETIVATETVAETTPEVDNDADSEEVDSGPAVIGTFDPATVAERPQSEFLFSVQAGDALADGACLWTRYTGSGQLDVVVFANGTGVETGDLYVQTAVTLDATIGGKFVHILVSGLAPDTTYRYAFVVRGATRDAPLGRSPIGRFRTAMAPDAERVITFGGTSCVNADWRPYRVLNRAAEAELDFFILAGDTTYCDGAKTLADYYEKWRTSFDTDGYRALLSHVSTYATWDDHEVDDNWNPETIASAQLAAAKKAFLDHIAIRQPESGEFRVWRNFRWGKTVELFILDCRGERLPSTRHTADPTYLSKAQTDWLKRSLRDSPCTFKLIVNSVPVTKMPPEYPQDKDRWDGYEPTRTEMLEYVGDIPGTLWLSGDFHFGCMTHIDPPLGTFFNQYEIFMGQGANLTNPSYEALETYSPGQWVFLTGTNNFVKFVCDPFASPPTITATFTDADGAALGSHVFEFRS